MRKKYIVTDPCYILPNDVWQDICHKCFNDKSEFNSELFNDEVTIELNKFANTSDAKACETGYGDWDNNIYSFDGGVIHSSFCADSGMVCVVEYTDNVQKALEEIPEPCYALIETYGNPTINFDRSDKDWTVVNITDESNVRFESINPDKGDE